MAMFARTRLVMTVAPARHVPADREIPIGRRRIMTGGDIVQSNAGATAIRRSTPRRLAVFLPALVFAGMAVLLSWGLTRNASDIPSALIGKPVPEFSLPPVQGRSLGLSSGDLRGEVSLVNVFASWCVACREEHPVFLRLAASKAVPLHGLNYKDRPQDAERWLDTLGDPYTRTGADLNGRVAIDWGVYGVPETFIVSADGRIAYKHIGPVTQEALDKIILPRVERLRAEARERRGTIESSADRSTAN